jgi:hypothetical protein
LIVRHSSKSEGESDEAIQSSQVASLNCFAEFIIGPRFAGTQAVYQDIVRHTSTKVAPWHVVPSDHKWFARVVIGSIILAALDGLDLRFPRADKASLALEQEAKGRKTKR